MGIVAFEHQNDHSVLQHLIGVINHNSNSPRCLTYSSVTPLIGAKYPTRGDREAARSRRQAAKDRHDLQQGGFQLAGLA